MTWKLVYTKLAQKDAKILASSGLKPKPREWLELIAEDPDRKPPPFEKLIGDVAGACSRRMSKHFPTASRLQNYCKALR